MQDRVRQMAATLSIRYEHNNESYSVYIEAVRTCVAADKPMILDEESS